jgi:hypothetical protein
MAGIEDLTNMMMTGTRTDVPPVQGPPVATNRVASGPPDAPPGRKRRPEAFQSLDELDDFLDFTTDDDLSLEDFQTNRGPMEGDMTISGDATALAEAVVNRTGGDINNAVDILDNAKAMLIASASGGGSAPQMMNNGGALKPVPEGKKGAGLRALPTGVRNNMGYMNMGGPLYAAEGRAISDRDTDMLRQMIMDSLANEDQSGRAMSDKDLEMFRKIDRSNQSGRAMSDKDLDSLGLSADAYYEKYFN